MRDMGHLPREMVHLSRNMHIPGLSQAKNRKKIFSSFSLGLVRDMHHLPEETLHIPREMPHIPREMVHLPRDMHIPVHPAVKNDEKFSHCRETGDGRWRCGIWVISLGR